MNQLWVAKKALYAASLLSTVFAAMLLTGCSGDTMATGSVSGKVTYEGKPVEGGSLTFVPDSPTGGGKPGVATIAADGTYRVSTYGTNDGAVIGKHKIRFSPNIVAPAAKELKTGESAPPSPAPTSPYSGLLLKPDTVEIKAGSNTVDIELVPKGKK
jgi:hypothetical protein